jgi:hypothetical protein
MRASTPAALSEFIWIETSTGSPSNPPGWTRSRSLHPNAVELIRSFGASIGGAEAPSSLVLPRSRSLELGPRLPHPTHETASGAAATDLSVILQGVEPTAADVAAAREAADSTRIARGSSRRDRRTISRAFRVGVEGQARTCGSDESSDHTHSTPIDFASSQPITSIHIGFSPTVSSYTCRSLVLSKISSCRDRPVTS